MTTPVSGSRPQPYTSAFSLVELLVVISIALTMAVVSGPLIGSLTGAGSTNRAATDFARTLELARGYAMSHQTYVRLAIGDVPKSAITPEGATVVLALFSADGTLTADSATDMANETTWPILGRPLVLRHFEVRDALNASAPDTSDDMVPSDSNIAGADTALTRQVADLGSLEFRSFIQFQPNGQAYVERDTPARQVKLAVDRRGAAGGQNPFILRMSGSNGSVRVLRKEDGIQ